MAPIERDIVHPMRNVDKEPEWSSLCNNVFEEYVDPDDVFGLKYERSSSNSSGHLFDTASGSEQSHQTTGTSPLPSHRMPMLPPCTPQKVEGHPRPKLGGEFWSKTLRALERNAADSEQRQQKLRSSKSHPEFLSLGGYPSPPAIPASPTDQSLCVKRQRGRTNAANGNRQQHPRSVLRGRPSGMMKASSTGIAPYATVRKSSASPSKMMNPSRYRAGFKEAWAERIASNPRRQFDISIPPSHIWSSGSPSAVNAPRNDAVPNLLQRLPLDYTPFMDAWEEQVSPLTGTFQRTRLHTPLASPAFRQNVSAHAANAAHFENHETLSPITRPPETVPRDDTAPMFTAPNKLDEFDFGFSTPPANNPWDIEASTRSNNYTTDQFATEHDPFASFASLETSVLPTTEVHGFDPTLPAVGLGISGELETLDSRLQTPPPIRYGQYANTVLLSEESMTPHRPFHSARTPTGSPTPAPATESRSRRRNQSRSRSQSRRSVSRHHRRTKSATASAQSTAPRSAADKAGGFVNYTPQDSNKILSGVAPSGSSKTKARREKEAADKRRKFSQAALKAVVDAGGSVEALQRAGLMA